MKCKLFKFIKSIERKSERKVQAVRTDNPKELKVCKEELTNIGIDFETSSRYSPRSNGVIERFNRKLLIKARSLLLQSNLPLSYWGEAMIHAINLHNITATPTLHGKTPYDMLFGTAPDISYLRIFVCLAFVHVEKQLRDNKFSLRGAKHALLFLIQAVFTRFRILLQTRSHSQIIFLLMKQYFHGNVYFKR